VVAVLNNPSLRYISYNSVPGNGVATKKAPKSRSESRAYFIVSLISSCVS